MIDPEKCFKCNIRHLNDTQAQKVKNKHTNMKMGTSLASPMVRTWRFHCHGPRGLTNPWSGNLRSCKFSGIAETKLRCRAYWITRAEGQIDVLMGTALR